MEAHDRGELEYVPRDEKERIWEAISFLHFVDEVGSPPDDPGGKLTPIVSERDIIDMREELGF